MKSESFRTNSGCLPPKKESTSAILEGQTYKTNIMMNQSDVDIEEIRSPPFANYHDESTFIFFDLETTGFGNAEMIQLSAISGEKQFDIYVTPTKNISPAAARITGIHTSGGMLYRGVTPLESVSPVNACKEFLDFVTSFERPILVGHNIEITIFLPL